MIYPFVAYVYFISSLIRISTACNGYVLKFHYLKNCGDNDIIQIKDAASTLDNDCNITPHGCISIGGFQSAIMHYRAEKKPLPPIEGDVDLCQALEDQNEYALLATASLGFPQSCPYEKQDFCLTGDKKVNISKYKKKLGITLGVSTVNMTFTHDSGITCLSLKVEFSKPRRKG